MASRGRDWGRGGDKKVIYGVIRVWFGLLNVIALHSSIVSNVPIPRTIETSRGMGERKRRRAGIRRGRGLRRYVINI